MVVAIALSIDIHADTGHPRAAAWRSWSPWRMVINPAIQLGRDVHMTALRYTNVQVSGYYGHNGNVSRNDLAGPNLTTMPKVLIECGNMNDAPDAALLVRPSVQRMTAAAAAIANSPG